jgi:oligosaccharide repeat unit polymerase
MYHAGSYLFYNFGLLEVLKLAFTGESVDYIVTGSGNIILSAFALLATILIGTIFEKKNKKHRFLLLVALGILFFYSSILNSRILFIQGIIFFAVIYYRKFHYSSQISRKNIILYSIIGVLFLVLTSGYRDYNKEGRLYTKSVMQWGITRISDYVVSTTNYSLEMPNLAVGYGFPNNVLPIINRIWDSQNDWHYDFVSIQQNYGSAEYTNKGSFGQIFLDFQNYFIPFVLFIGLLYALVWKNFDKGKVFGYFFYPIFLYNLLESMRIFYLGTEPAEFLLLLCLSSYLICKKSYVVE